MANSAFWVTRQPNNQLPAVSRTDQQITARSSSNKGKYAQQFLLRPHLKMWIYVNCVKPSRKSEQRRSWIHPQCHHTAIHNKSLHWWLLVTMIYPAHKGVSTAVLVHVCLLPAHMYKHHTSAPQSLLSQTQPERWSGFASNYMPCTWSTDIQSFTPFQINIVLLKMNGR